MANHKAANPLVRVLHVRVSDVEVATVRRLATRLPKIPVTVITREALRDGLSRLERDPSRLVEA